MEINNQINVALKKICSDQFRAKYIFPETVTLFITKDDAYRFIGTIKEHHHIGKNYCTKYQSWFNR